MGDAPKLYDHKPKKGLLKQKAKDYSAAPPKPSPPPPSMASTKTPPPKESFARRYKFVWPLLLAVNLGIGAYLLVRTKKKDAGGEVEEVAANVGPAPVESTTAPVPEKTLPVPTVVENVKVQKPIPEDQQRAVFQWILEEKRKVKPSNPEEKKRIDEEKAILKQFIKSKSIPTL